MRWIRQTVRPAPHRTIEVCRIRPDPSFPRFEWLIDALEGLVAAHPATTFVGLHVGCYPEDLGWVGRMLDA